MLSTRVAALWLAALAALTARGGDRLGSSARGATGEHVVEAPRSPAAAAEWIAVAPRTLAETLEPLAAHRVKQGLKSAAIVPLEAIESAFTEGNRTQRVEAFLRDAAKRKGARFVLLVGDAETIPPEHVDGFFKKPCATDAAFARDNGDATPDRAVGRFPSSDPVIVRALVDRTIAYETDARPGGWRRRITFLAASGGFGAVIDQALEAAVSGLLDREMPPEFDLRVLRPDSGSPYGVARGEEKQAIAELWNAGSLIGLYAGHGSKNGLHTSTDAGPTRTIFTSKDAELVDVRNGAPFLIFFACNTGEFDGPKGRCLATALMERPRGPIAVLGASQISHPYADLLISHEMNGLFREAISMPVGELVREAKARALASKGAFRGQVDKFAGMLGISEEDRAQILRYELSLYNLFGDPAVRLRRPDAKTAVRAPASAAPGEAIEFEVTSDAPESSQVLVSLESSRSSPPAGRGFAAANDRTVARQAATLVGGRCKDRIVVPEDARPGRYVLVADVRGTGAQGLAATVIQVASAKAAAGDGR